jgi:hypothetical protein
MEELAIKAEKEANKRYYCPFENCQKNYQFENELQRHLKYKHPKK